MPLRILSSLALLLSPLLLRYAFPAYAQTLPAGDAQARQCSQFDDSPKAAFDLDQKLAQNGDHEAAFWLGIAYLQGCGTVPDPTLADKWLKEGAQEPSQKALLGQMFRSGQEVPRDVLKAIHWYLAAGDSGSQFEVARIYQLGDGVSIDRAKAIHIYRGLLKKTADPYARRAQMELGNLVLDGLYTSGDPRLDLSWARAIAQELIGQEQYKLGFSSNGSAMDLPATPEVTALVVRTAASYNVDLAQWQMSEGAVPMSLPEANAWLSLAGEKQAGFRQRAMQMKASFSPEQVKAAAQELGALEQTRTDSGAYYRADDSLRNATMAELESDLAHYSDPDRQVRLAYNYELKSSDPVAARHAMDLYRIVRDQRVSGVRLKIGTEYLLGRDGFPKSPEIAAQWYGFAARGGSAEACKHLAELTVAGVGSAGVIAEAVCSAH